MHHENSISPIYFHYKNWQKGMIMTIFLSNFNLIVLSNYNIFITWSALD